MNCDFSVNLSLVTSENSNSRQERLATRRLTNLVRSFIQFGIVNDGVDRLLDQYPIVYIGPTNI